MTENLEQKSSSDLTEDAQEEGVGAEQEEESEREPLPPIVVEPLAQPYRLVCWFYYEDLKAKFDLFWEKNEKKLSRLAKSKKQKGGKARNARKIVEKQIGVKRLYSEVLINEIHDHLNDEIMFIDGYELFNFEPGEQVQLGAVVYFTPKLKPKKEINFACPYPPVLSEKEEWERRCKEIQADQKTHVAVPEGEDQIKENHDLNLTILAEIDGEPYPNGTIRDQWIEWREMVVPEIQEALLEHKRGDVFELEFEPKHDPEVLGKTVQVEITVHEIKIVNYPEVDDDLAKKAGFDDLKAFRKKFVEDYKRYKTNAEQATATDHILGQIIRNSPIPPLPQEWLKKNIDRMIDLHLDRFRGNQKQAMLAVGVTDEESFRNRFKGQIYRDYMQRLAMLWYGSEYDVDPGGAEFIDDVMERIKWTDADETSVEELGSRSDQEDETLPG